MTEVLPPAVNPDNLPKSETSSNVFKLTATIDNKDQTLTVDAHPFASGGFGKIHRAVNAEGNYYALKTADPAKFLNRYASLSPNEVKNLWIRTQNELEREAQIIKSMNCPYIIHGHGIAVRKLNEFQVTPRESIFNEQVFAVLEMLNRSEWGHLRQARQEKYRFTVPGTYDVLDKSITGLLYANNNYAPQYDIKPDNIMVHPTSDGTYDVKLIDFGVTKLVMEPAAFVNPKLTNKDQVVVSTGYIPPELVFEGNYTQQGTVFSLGVIGAEMLLGHQIVANHTDQMEIITHYLRTNTSVVSERIDLFLEQQGYTAEVRDVFVTATDIKQNRYKTLEEFRHALKKIHHLHSTESPKPHWSGLQSGDTQQLQISTQPEIKKANLNTVQRLIQRLRGK